jgi:hypothetical protein
MGLTVNFRTAQSVVTSRNFPVGGVGVSVYGKATGAAGLGEPFTNMRIEITGDSIYLTQDGRANLFGDYAFFFRTPPSDGNASVKLVATYTVAGQEIVVVPISFGQSVPDTLPEPPSTDLFAKYAIPIVLIVVAVAVLPRLFSSTTSH